MYLTNMAIAANNNNRYTPRENGQIASDTQVFASIEISEEKNRGETIRSIRGSISSNERYSRETDVGLLETVLNLEVI